MIFEKKLLIKAIFEEVDGKIVATTKTLHIFEASNRDAKQVAPGCSSKISTGLHKKGHRLKSWKNFQTSKYSPKKVCLFKMFRDTLINRPHIGTHCKNQDCPRKIRVYGKPTNKWYVKDKW